MQPQGTPIIWSIAASDSGGGAGIQADNATIKALGGHGVNIITAITAQNSLAVTKLAPTSPAMLQAQFDALIVDMVPQAIKIGLLGSTEAIAMVAQWLSHPALADCPVVLDPVLGSSSGFSFSDDDYIRDLIEVLAPRVTVLTPNLPEAKRLLAADDDASIEQLAAAFIDSKIANVVIKGGHNLGSNSLGGNGLGGHSLASTGQESLCQDYWRDNTEAYWLASPRLDNPNTHGTGCVFSSSLATALGQGFEIKDALVLAKMTINQGIAQARGVGSGPGPLVVNSWPEEGQYLPVVSRQPQSRQSIEPFARCDTEQLGLYPCVASSDWIARLLAWGVTTVQLRIKDRQLPELEQEIQAAIALGRQYQARVFINDYWQLAIKHGAYGIHLGQEDLDSADIAAIKAAGIRLGISSHCHYEVARAQGLKPSYIACGPIYDTDSKQMRFGPQGIDKLAYWCKLLAPPLVAIGGINLARGREVLATGVGSIALISAITAADDPRQATDQLLALFPAEKQ